MAGKYLIRVKHMRVLKRKIAELMNYRGRALSLQDEYDELRAQANEIYEESEQRLIQALRENCRANRWQRLAVVAFIAMPGSFVAGGFLLQRLISWWW